ncbi:hypothetical protein BN1723_010649 [Verticillium longisporum]|uniref:carbamoyl-phosphate synthase (ammonia) n=1 Tax=Verticillium longisporum TaxID=100787 RepID=A0A0G4L033_VERLO|nr:hypothetical protein BN1723_010649 [Verticillium longisporum]
MTTSSTVPSGDLATRILLALFQKDPILSAESFPESAFADTKAALDRLASRSMVSYETIEKEEVTLEAEGQQFVEHGSHEARVFEALNTEDEVRAVRKNFGIRPWVKKIDTLAAEFPADTNYLYTTYNASSHDVTFEDKGTIILGSGVYRIGSSVEFDWCAVSATQALREMGNKTIMINYNPETYSTDFDTADKLYFEELSYERVMDIYELESASGVVVSVGGQLPQNIALRLQETGGANVLGTDPKDIDKAEDRQKFSEILDSIGVDQPAWKELTSVAEAEAFATQVGYPVLVRPSYVLSGAAMTVIRSQEDLKDKLEAASNVSESGEADNDQVRHLEYSRAAGPQGRPQLHREERRRPPGQELERCVDEDVTIDMRVYGWGLSLERPTMIKYGISNIRELLGHKVDLNFIERNAAVRLDKN